MGCQVSAGGYSVNYSVGAWLVAEMCSLWFCPERDMDDPKYGQQCWIDFTSLNEANRCVPFNLFDYLVWRKENKISYYERRQLTEYDFKQAREFIKTCSENKLTASLSY